MQRLPFLFLVVFLGLTQVDVRAQAITSVENPKWFVRVQFEQATVRLPAEERQRLIDLVRKPMSEPLCRYQSWYVVGHVDRNAGPEFNTKARQRAEYVAGLLRLYGVESQYICGVWSQNFPGEVFPASKSDVVEAEVICQLVPHC